MSQKQIFNKEYQLANWIMYQVLRDEPHLTRKSRVKLFRWLAVNFYDVEKYRPEEK